MGCEPSITHLCAVAADCADHGTTWGEMIAALISAAATDCTTRPQPVDRLAAR